MSETRKLAAIVAADVVGYSRLLGEDEAGTARAVREHREAARPIVASRGGRPTAVGCARKAITINRLLQYLDVRREPARSNAAGRESPGWPSTARRLHHPGQQQPKTGRICFTITALAHFIHLLHENAARPSRSGSVSLFRAETGPLSSLLFKRQKTAQFSAKPLKLTPFPRIPGAQEPPVFPVSPC
jgi:class 3 adenylate cyclase